MSGRFAQLSSGWRFRPPTWANFHHTKNHYFFWFPLYNVKFSLVGLSIRMLLVHQKWKRTHLEHENVLKEIMYEIFMNLQLELFVIVWEVFILITSLKKQRMMYLPPNLLRLVTKYPAVREPDYVRIKRDEIKDKRKKRMSFGINEAYSYSTMAKEDVIVQLLSGTQHFLPSFNRTVLQFLFRSNNSI